MKSYVPNRWLSVTTALSLIWINSASSMASMEETSETGNSLRSSVAVNTPQNSPAEFDVPTFPAFAHKAARETIGTYEPSSLHLQQEILKNAILKAVSAEPNFIQYVQDVLKDEPFALSLKQSAELVTIEPDNTLNFIPLNKLINQLESIKQDHPHLSIVQELLKHYQASKQVFVQTKHLFPKVRLTGDHLGSYLIPQIVAQDLSWRDLYGYQPSKGSQFGNHRVLGKGGVHFKLSPGGHTEEGGLNELRPGMEYALSSFYQLLHPEIAPPSTLLALQERTIHQLPPAHPFTKGLQSLIIEGKVTAEEFFARNPDVKEALKSEIQVYKQPSILQASLTKGDMSLLEFIIKAQHDPEIYKTVDLASYSALFIASILTNPSDGKPDNFRVAYQDKKADGRRIKIPFNDT